ncbi:hypothetical protein JIG36_22610 [Actinoplanes sp. LDG1-06]|uniref:Uncharacterized protein n=1 Tax=Paractinoplanes ovalisporus TaxID=2810368 RepID=A0ABS2AEU3_9ACTN|nr:SMI1/KNR4 family protein [Actinoplanes ovalisporus]MBM2618357.1 hypothetical protein [Actinoplanes ovalisporus]
MTVLQHLPDVGLSDVGPALDGSEPFLGELPPDYAATLRVANGFTVHRGMNRVFGVRPDRHMDVRSWNDEQAWRFAWNGRADSFLMVGGTAFGDQYALRRRADGSYDDVVYLLDANLLGARPVFDSFEQFLEREIVHNALTPTHPVALACVAKFGEVPPTRNVVLTPSMLLGGPEDVATMVTIDSYTAMIYGGDIYAAVMSVPDEAPVVGVEPWSDDEGRQRLRVRFGEGDPGWGAAPL